MNWIVMIIDALVSFVRRNPIFCLVVLILALGAPSLLAGIASAILYVILALVVAALIFGFVMRMKIRRLQRDMNDRFGGGFSDFGQPNPGGSARQRRQDEGDVKIYRRRDAAGKRVSEDVGDYVDFEEEKNTGRS
ncbi:MAG: DUF4834 family protein [Alistipes sp.]|nr:DUF4834 family protein [Alistipes sp.]